MRIEYEGKEINGIQLTRSGMLAAAHLVGPGGLKKYLRSGGKNIPKDGNNTSIETYLKKFAKDSQFLVITHRKGTMEAADTVYGITMEEKGISKLLSMKLK